VRVHALVAGRAAARVEDAQPRAHLPVAEGAEPRAVATLAGVADRPRLVLDELHLALLERPAVLERDAEVDRLAPVPLALQASEVPVRRLVVRLAQRRSREHDAHVRPESRGRE